jgi:hypothetical protein
MTGIRRYDEEAICPMFIVRCSPVVNDGLLQKSVYEAKTNYRFFQKKFNQNQWEFQNPQALLSPFASLASSFSFPQGLHGQLLQQHHCLLQSP